MIAFSELVTPGGKEQSEAKAAIKKLKERGKSRLMELPNLARGQWGGTQLGSADIERDRPVSAASGFGGLVKPQTFR